MEDTNTRHEEYWSWFTGIIFILFPIDLITTIFAVSKYGIDGERNPFMVLLLQSEWYVFVIVNIGLAFLTVGFFHWILKMGEFAPVWMKPKYYLIVEVWIGCLIASGFFIFVNNLLTIIFGESILALI